MFDEARRRHAEPLAAYEAERTGLVNDPEAADPRNPKFASVLTLEGGVRTKRAAVEWCDWMRERLESLERLNSASP